MRKKRILIVENEETILWTLENALGSHFDVLIASSGEEGIEHVNGVSEIDLLLTDLNLGVACDGVDVAQAMRERFPEAPVVLMSGDPKNEPRIEALLSLPNTTFLAKPFTPDELMASLNG